jgi:acyl carrier protein
MTDTALLARISNVFADHLHLQPPSPDSDLIESGALDSLSFIELLAHLEKEFSIRIPLDNLDLNEFRSIAQIGEFIRKKLPESEVRVGSYSRV